ncbi:hypothetical protein [Brachybacterium sp.]|uniref:hypothetical protein n=1 Tax=Brachybacterium sp. TaxID=1891286 RepID=UPI002ED6A7E1
MQHDNSYPPHRPKPTRKGPGHFAGLALGFAIVALVIGIVGSLGVWALAAIWGAIL